MFVWLDQFSVFMLGWQQAGLEHSKQGNWLQMLDGFDFVRQASGRADMRDELLREADDAFCCADRNRCIDLIEQLYDFFDDNIG